MLFFKVSLPGKRNKSKPARHEPLLGLPIGKLIANMARVAFTQLRVRTGFDLLLIVQIGQWLLLLLRQLPHPSRAADCHAACLHMANQNAHVWLGDVKGAAADGLPLGLKLQATNQADWSIQILFWMQGPAYEVGHRVCSMAGRCAPSSPCEAVTASAAGSASHCSPAGLVSGCSQEGSNLHSSHDGLQVGYVFGK